jgi:hypothetical protein
VAPRVLVSLSVTVPPWRKMVDLRLSGNGSRGEIQGVHSVIPMNMGIQGASFRVCLGRLRSGSAGVIDAR